MTSLRFCTFAAAFLLSPLVASTQESATGALGLMQGSSDIGHAQTGGSSYDPAAKSYKVSGGGADVWGSADDFRFTWTRMSGDEALTADVQVSQPSTHPKAKGMLMIRQSLDPGSPYADIAIHGDGHITLQYRLTAGGETKDTDLPQHGATTLRIERKGNLFTATAAPQAGDTGNSASITIQMDGPVYVGLGVCSHSTTALQTVSFSHIRVAPSSASADSSH